MFNMHIIHRILLQLANMFYTNQFPICAFHICMGKYPLVYYTLCLLSSSRLPLSLYALHRLIKMDGLHRLNGILYQTHALSSYTFLMLIMLLSHI